MSVQKLSELDALQRNLVFETEIGFRKTERSLQAGKLKKAKKYINDCAGTIRQLERLAKKRRGYPRRALMIKIRYLSIWQRALVGLIETAKSHSIGQVITTSASIQARAYREEFPLLDDAAELLRLFQEFRRP